MSIQIHITDILKFIVFAIAHFKSILREGCRSTGIKMHGHMFVPMFRYTLTISQNVSEKSHLLQCLMAQSLYCKWF
jgi:hypothetical protein